MSQQETNEPQGEVPDDPANLRQALKDQGKVNSDLRGENDRLQREIAFRDAGVPADGPGKYFRKAYDGDLDADSIKAAALADDIISDQPPQTEVPPEPQVPSDELAAIDRIGVTGEAPPEALDPGSLESQYRNASSADELMEIARAAGQAPPR